MLDLVLKVPETQDELEQCSKLLHETCVGSGFILFKPCGTRDTKYHSSPTTTTLCASFDGAVVETIFMLREGAFRFPMQPAFDIEVLRKKGGNIAGISASAIRFDFRKNVGAIIFPFMKFMRQHGAEFFDTRHLVIAVKPKK